MDSQQCILLVHIVRIYHDGRSTVHPVGSYCADISRWTVNNNNKKDIKFVKVLFVLTQQISLYSGGIGFESRPVYVLL
jgi:hypothetical protein